MADFTILCGRITAGTSDAGVFGLCSPLSERVPFRDLWCNRPPGLR